MHAHLLALSDAQTGLAGVVVAAIAGIPGFLAWKATNRKEDQDVSRLTDDDVWRRVRESLQEEVTKNAALTSDNAELRRINTEMGGRLDAVEKHAKDCDEEVARLRKLIEGTP